jgi:hypothetical protein
MISQLVEKLPAFYQTRRFIPVFTGSHTIGHGAHRNHTGLTFILTLTFSIHFNIILSILPSMPQFHK